MRNIDGRKYYLLYLIFVFAFDAFLPPALTKRMDMELRQDIEIRDPPINRVFSSLL